MTTPSHMPKYYEFVVKQPHKAAVRIAELEAENKRIREAAQAVLDNVNVRGAVDEMYAFDAAEFGTLAKALEQKP